MSFPTIAATNLGNEGSNSTSHVLNLPSGIASGHLLIMALAMDGNAVLTWPAGWSVLSTSTNSGGDGTLEVRYRIADGSEGASITVTTDASERGSYITWRITNWHGTTPPEAGTPVAGTTNPNAPNVTASWGSADNLFIWVCGWGNSTQDISAYPSDYTVSQMTDSGSAAGLAGIAMAARELASASDNPGAATLGSTLSVANTLVVRPSAGGHTVTVNQVTETDSVQAITSRKVKALAQASETDSPQVIAPARRYAVALASETDSVQTLTHRKVKAMGQASETDSAQVVAPARRYGVGQISETDTAQSLTHARANTVNQSSETDAAQPVTLARRYGVAQASETDAAQTLTHRKVKTLGQASETDSAQAISPVFGVLIEQVQETDLAQSLFPLKRVAVAQVVELDLAQALTVRKFITVQLVSETDSAQGLTRRKLVAVALVGEVDLAQVLTHLKRVTLAMATETDAALTITYPGAVLRTILVSSIAPANIVSTATAWVDGVDVGARSIAEVAVSAGDVP